MSALAENIPFSFPPTKASRLVPVHGFLLKKKSHFGQNSGRPPPPQCACLQSAGWTNRNSGSLSRDSQWETSSLPSHFYFVSQRGTASSRFKPLQTSPIPTLRGSGRDRILISRKQRFSVDVRMFGNSDSLSVRLNKLGVRGIG